MVYDPWLFIVIFCWHVSIREQIVNKGSRSDIPPKSPYPGEPQGRTKSIGGDGYSHHWLSSLLRTTVGEGSMYADESLEQGHMRLFSAAWLGHHQADSVGVVRLVLACSPPWGERTGCVGTFPVRLIVAVGSRYWVGREADPLLWCTVH